MLAAYWLIPSQSELLGAALAMVTLAWACLILMAFSRGVADANFIFLFFFLIYQVVNPALYVSGTAWVGEGDFFVENWQAARIGSLYGLFGLATYAVGMWIGTRSPVRPSGEGRDLLTPWVTDRVVLILGVVAILAWAALFVRSGMPIDAFLGRPEERSRGGEDITSGGFGVFLELAFLMNIAVLVYFIGDPNRRIFSLSGASVLYLVVLSNSIRGSRLVLVMSVVGVLLAQAVLRRGRSESAIPVSAARRVLQVGGMLLGGVALFVLAIGYGIYRTGGGNKELDVDRVLFFMANVFDTSITYFMVLQKVPSQIEYWMGKSFLTHGILRIPTVFFPEKYDHLWASAKFTLLFYGYDQNQAGTVARGFSMFAELFLNFGVYGIVIAMLFFGWMNTVLSRMAFRPGVTRYFIVLYVFYLLYFVPFSFKSGLSQAIVYADLKILPFILIVLLLRRLESMRPAAVMR